MVAAEEHHPQAIRVDLGGEAVEYHHERVYLRQLLPGVVAGKPEEEYENLRERTNSGSTSHNQHRNRTRVYLIRISKKLFI